MELPTHLECHVESLRENSHPRRRSAVEARDALLAAGWKWCPMSGCNTAKPLSAFRGDKSLKSGYKSTCKECSDAQLAEWRTANPEHIREYRSAYAQTPTGQRSRRRHLLRKLYGLRLRDYERMLADQGGGCGICGKPPEENGRALCVDHDHGTGAVRGILCDACNQAIGLLCDSVSQLEAAKAYLISHQSENKP